MADDVTITTGANATPVGGTIVAADEIGGVKYQRMKVTLGADGAADMDLDSGQQTKANSLPVTLASDEDPLAVTVASLPLPSGAAIAANQQAAATTPTIYNVTMTNSDTEYSQALPANTRRFSLQCLTEFDIRFAFVTGKVATPTAPYAIVRGGMNYWESNLDLTSKTLYFGSPDAAKVAEIIVWT